MTTVDKLDLERCRRLLRTHELGRLAVRRDDSVDIFPINYLVHDDELYFRSAPGSKLMDVAANPRVAFEIDGRSGPRLWSVVLHGVARRLSTEEEIERSGIQTLRTAQGGEKFNYIALTTESISGREFLGSRRRWNSGSIMIAGALVVIVVAIAGIVSQFLGR